jgi:hypothetical protein
MVPWREANTHVLTHTLHYGMGVFEGVRAYTPPSGAPHFPAEGAHQPPVRFGAHHGMTMPFTKDEINEAHAPPCARTIAQRLPAPDGFSVPKAWACAPRA